jgi:hypothetical protein
VAWQRIGQAGACSTEETDLAAELKRGLAFVRRDKEPNATKKQTDQLKKAKRR